MKKQQQKLLIWIGLALIFVLAVGGVWLYTGTYNNAKAAVIKAFRLPIAVVGGRTISIGEIEERTAIARRLALGNTTTDQLRLQVFNALVETKQLEAIAAKYDITVTDQEEEQEYTIITKGASASTAESIEAELQNKFGMDAQDFKKTVLHDQLLKQKLIAWFNSNKSLNAQANATAEAIVAQLDNGANFAELAKQYSEDESSKVLGGDSGSVALSSLHPEIAAKLAGAEKGKSYIIGSRNGLHVIFVDDVLTKDAEEEKYALRQIFLKGTQFEPWYQAEKNKISVKKFISFN